MHIYNIFLTPSGPQSHRSGSDFVQP